MSKATFQDGTLLKRYDLPSTNGLDGWATIVLGADGFFAAVTDYGNYACRWCSTGEADFRAFILRVDGDYMLSKIASQVYDREATRRAIKRHIIELRRTGWFTRGRARAEWDHLADCDLASDVGFHMWLVETTIVYAAELREECFPRDACAFAERTLPRLKDAIRAEMAAEKGQAR